MALSKIDTVKFKSLSQTLSMLLQHETSLETAKVMLGEQISDLEDSSNHMIKFITLDDDSVALEVLDLSKDFVRTRNPNSETQVLRAKIQGVGIDVKLFKEGDFKFSNQEAIDAIRALAAEVEGLPFELNAMGVSNVRKLDADDSEDLEDSEYLDSAEVDDVELEDKLSDNEDQDVTESDSDKE